jgi:hypothetical protein
MAGTIGGWTTSGVLVGALTASPVPFAAGRFVSGLSLGAGYIVVFVTAVWLFSAQVMVYAATNAVYAPSERATGLGWVTGSRPHRRGRRPVAERRAHRQLFACAGLTGAAMISLVSLAAHLTSQVRTRSSSCWTTRSTGAVASISTLAEARSSGSTVARW